ncbi:MAG TPA: PhzF family phenazine biosynthesis protein [Longimicrobiales bacterium]
MAQRIVQVDAFTTEPFAGNPAAVCVMEETRDDAWMQNVAREMNLSETAFLYPEGNASYRLRWFTPTVEVDLCGHATLASAHVLYESNAVDRHQQVRFQTRSGLLTAESEDGWIKLNFPATESEPFPTPFHFDKALNGIQLLNVEKSMFDYIVEAESAAVVRGLKPNLSLLELVDARGVIVTARSDDPRYDFISRFFAPAAGVPEDPVTGSAHCCLAPYWASRLRKKEMIGYQASARGGVVKVAMHGDRVMLYGQAVTVLRGELSM